ncbi:MAG: hypothetical protein Q7S13_03360, partial [Candidatus Omnitrophota bacterium]|nr:hypothetical protein [Candidatus Omnitrophota bacterium]
LYADVAIKAYEAKILTEKPDIQVVLKNLKDAQAWFSYADVASKAIEAKILTEKPDIQQALNELKGQWYWYADVAIKAYEAKILTEKPDIQVVLNNLKDAQAWFSYVDVAIKAYEAFRDTEGFLLGEVAYPLGLPESYIVYTKGLEILLGLKQNEMTKLYESGEKVLNKVEKLNAQAEREDQRIDVNAFRQYLLPALSYLETISPQVTSQLLDQYLSQRGYLPMLRDVFELFAFLSLDEMKILKGFYDQTGTSYSASTVNFNPTDFLVSLGGYLKAYQALGLTAEDFRKDLMKEMSSKEVILNRLGKRVFQTLADKLGIKINLDQLKTEGRNILQEWDLRYLGLLAATQGRWKDEERALFKLLIQSSIEGTAAGLLYPPAYKDYPAESYGKENRELVLKIRRHNLSVLKEMERLGLNVGVWLSANEYVKPVVTSGEGEQRRAIDIIRDFKEKWETFKLWMGSKGQAEGLSKLEQAIGSWANISEKTQAGLINNRGALKKLKGHINKIVQESPGRVPEEAADLGRVIDEINNYNENSPSARSGAWMWFWKREVGKDTFAGNCAGSCTALDRNASAIFEFELDQGTQYLFIGDRPYGNVRGYMRFFVGLNTQREPMLYVDTIDGTLAGQYQGQMTEQIKQFARALGIKETNIENRTVNISAKIGGTLTEKYFHHSRLTMESSDVDGSIDTWQPKSGWPSRHSGDSDPVPPAGGAGSDSSESDSAMVGDWLEGDIIEHAKFGRGVIKGKPTRDGERIVVVRFGNKHTLALSFAEAAAQLKYIGAPASPTTPDKGGIDLNPAGLDIETQGQGADFPVPTLEQLENMDFNGLVPVIYKIVPANIPLILGENSQTDTAPGV